MARYDYGLRGFPQGARRRPGRPWHLAESGDDPRGGPPRHAGADRGRWTASPRVTARYNLDYVRPRPADYPVNYNPYGGDTAWRVGDYTRYDPPYITRGGSFTYRGGRRMGWERMHAEGPYRRPPGVEWDRYGRDYRW